MVARVTSIALMIAFSFLALDGADAADVRVLTTGAFRPVVEAMAPDFTRERGDTIVIVNDTAGAVLKRVESGEAFDALILTPDALRDLTRKGKIMPGSATNLAKVGVGVAVKEGAPKPDISSVEAFKRTLIDAKSVAYIDPASGGSSGVYLAKLFDKLGVADLVARKAVLVEGGLVATHVASGEAELGIHQISEILPVTGVTLVGPLPPAIQNDTVYAAGVSASARDPAAARAFLALMQGPAARRLLAEKGMSPAGD